MVLAICRRRKGYPDQHAAQHKGTGRYCCQEPDHMTEKYQREFQTLDQVAEFLRENKGAGVRVDPGWTVVRKNIFIDGEPL